MKQASAAVQELMRDMARLFDQAKKVNTHMVQIDAFVGNSSETAELLKGLEDARAQYKASWQRARDLAVALDPSTSGTQPSDSDSSDELSKLQEERDRLYAEAMDKSDQVHGLLERVRQLQLTSAQLLQISK
ncbi:hypothetical protein FBU59_003307 [Linderina macrospora]|uniref:Uncharacterized protein n=1 Tax=Linderina macrospora TaxID=4868 RepID=A0ACC1J8P8_9FUNG|nr:hypothetical protein FBU59_003307 [Linderina macrospora]